MANRPKMGEIYKTYVERCFKSGAMDFDDLLLRTNELLSRFPDVLAKYQDRFRYVMVDEYQDTNHSQYLIVRALADRFQNICVVGDDSQSIYAFRGANINNILNFQKHYPDVKTFKLEQNYRSSRNIVEAANSLIEKNKTKLDKEIFTANPDGPKVKVMRTISDGEEGRWVANSIFENKMNHQLTNDKFCILYRTNAQSRAMEDSLRKKRIAYKIYGGTSFYQRKEIKDILSYLRILINPQDDIALGRIINYPARGIGATTIDKLTIAADHYKKPLFEIVKHIENLDLKINAGTKAKLKNFANMIEALTAESKKMNAFEIADLVVKKTQIVKDLTADGTPEGVSKESNVEELLNGIQYFVDEAQKEDKEVKEDSLAVFLEDVSLKTDLDSDKEDDEPMVSLMTIHMSKGLEYSHVYIVGLEESLFPSAMSMNSRSELEEERRLFYVAITRAEQQAYLSYAQTRYRWGKLTDCEPSQFLDEIDPKYLEYITPKKLAPSRNNFVDSSLFDDDVPKDKIRYRKPISRTSTSVRTNKPGAIKKPLIVPKNMKPVSKVASRGGGVSDSKIAVGTFVEHARFGKGEVLKLEGVGGDAKAEIRFEKDGLKKLILKFAKLNVVK